MRDLNTEELGQVYGAGGGGRCGSPCGGGRGSKSRKSKSKSKKCKSKSKKSKRRSHGC